MGQIISREHGMNDLGVEMDAVPTITLAVGASISHVSSTALSTPSSMEDDEGDDPDSEEVFEDACDYLVDDSSDLDVLAGETSRDTDRQRSFSRKHVRHCNSILITTGMILGLIFAFFQWRQQTWSNNMSALQTCLTMKQMPNTSVNSSYCDSVLRQGIRTPPLRRQVTHASSLSSEVPQKSISWLALTVCIVICSVSLVHAMRVLPSFFKRAYAKRLRTHDPLYQAVTEDRHVLPTAHVGNHIPRSITTALQQSIDDPAKRRVRSDAMAEDDEHQYYVRAQEALAQEMRVRAQGWNDQKERLMWLGSLSDSEPLQKDNPEAESPHSTLEPEDSFGLPTPAAWNETVSSSALPHQDGVVDTLSAETSDGLQAFMPQIKSPPVASSTTENESPQRMQDESPWGTHHLSPNVHQRPSLYKSHSTGSGIVNPYTGTTVTVSELSTEKQMDPRFKTRREASSTAIRAIWNEFPYILKRSSSK